MSYTYLIITPDKKRFMADSAEAYHALVEELQQTLSEDEELQIVASLKEDG